MRDRVNQYVRGRGDDTSAGQTLVAFSRFPVWMWRNRGVETFGWLRQYNDSRPSHAPQVGFYGLDLYSLYQSSNIWIE
jgi:erythromycin esterase-like protein